MTLQPKVYHRFIMPTEEGKQPHGSDGATEEILADNRVLVVGAGARRLAYCGCSCILRRVVSHSREECRYHEVTLCPQ